MILYRQFAFNLWRDGKENWKLESVMGSSGSYSNNPDGRSPLLVNGKVQSGQRVHVELAPERICGQTPTEAPSGCGS